MPDILHCYHTTPVAVFIQYEYWVLVAYSTMPFYTNTDLVFDQASCRTAYRPDRLQPNVYQVFDWLLRMWESAVVILLTDRSTSVVSLGKNQLHLVRRKVFFCPYTAVLFRVKPWARKPFVRERLISCSSTDMLHGLPGALPAVI